MKWHRRQRLGHTGLVPGILILLLGSALSCAAQVTAEDLRWDFEEGSLAAAETVGPNDLALALRGDAGEAYLYGWYDFKIVSHALNQTVHFRFTNGDNWQTEHHQPVYSYDGRVWQRISLCWIENGQLHFQQTF